MVVNLINIDSCSLWRHGRPHPHATRIGLATLLVVLESGHPAPNTHIPQAMHRASVVEQSVADDTGLIRDVRTYTQAVQIKEVRRHQGASALHGWSAGSAPAVSMPPSHLSTTTHIRHLTEGIILPLQYALYCSCCHFERSCK